MWQAHRERWFPQGLEIVAVALDVEAEEAKPFIEQANASYPCLIDQAHVCDELFGFVNVPNAVWIDEQGMIVRPAEPAHPGRNPFTESFRSIDLATLPPDVADVLREARKIRSDPEQYVAMIDDWVAHGSESRFALAPDEVVRRSAHRGDDEARAAAEFELGQWLHRAGDHAAAIPHWRNAHRPPARQLDVQAPGVELRRPDAPGSYRRVRQLVVRGHQGARRRELLPRGDPVVARIDVPDGPGGDAAMVWSLRPEMAGMVDRMIRTAYQRSRLPASEREVARMRIAQLNACDACETFRAPSVLEAGVTDELYAHVEEWRTWPGYSDRQRLAAEYAERFAADHRAIDDELFARLRAHYADDEILDLTLCCAVFLGLGRTLEVLGITDNCPLDI